MNNIVARLRARDKVTQAELAKRSFVSRQIITRLESFTTDNVPDSVCHALSRGNESVEYIKNVYRAERNEFLERNRNMLRSNANYYEVLNDAVDFTMNMHNGRTSPLQVFRVYIFSEYGLPTSQKKFCQWTGLHTAIANRVELGKVPFENIGAYLEVLTTFFGCTPEHLKILGKLHDDYYVKR